MKLEPTVRRRPSRAFALTCMLLVACSAGPAVRPKPGGTAPADVAPAAVKVGAAPTRAASHPAEAGPDFPPSLGLEGLDWYHVVWRAGAWGKEGEPVEE